MNRDAPVIAFLLIIAATTLFGVYYALDQLLGSGASQRASIPPRAIPENLREMRVLDDRLGLSKAPFLNYHARCSTVTDIAVGEFHETAGEELLLIDCQHAQVVDLAGRTLRTVQFAEALNFPKVHRIGRGLSDWIAVDEGASEQIKAASATGSIVWRRHANNADYGVAAGRLEADASPEFVIWKDRTRGLELVRHDGTSPRSLSTDDDVKSVVILEGDRRKQPSLCYAVADRELVCLSTDGTVIARHKPDAPALNYMTSVRWPELASDQMFMQPFSDTLNFLTFDGKKVATFIAPSLKNQLMWVPLRTAVVRFPGRSESYFVFLTRLYAYPRSVLHIYDRSGALVYHEILEGMYGGLGVAADRSGRATGIFVGGSSEVLRYSLAAGERIKDSRR